MRLSPHYYVLSLGERTNRLYEAFRETLIDIRNTWFPFDGSSSPSQPAMNDVELEALIRTVDHRFSHYYENDPLGVVLVGTERLQSAFTSITVHADLIIGRDEADHSKTSASDLGAIVWPIVKRVMASAGRPVAGGLEAATRAGNLVAGIDAVIRSVDVGVGATLWVEDGYRVQSPKESLLLEDFDNIVDHVVEKVLALGGNVLFVEDGSLGEFQQIALILPAESGSRPARASGPPISAGHALPEN